MKIYENLDLSDLDEGILTQKEIGKLFGVSHTIISYIKIGKIWKNIKEKY